MTFQRIALTILAAGCGLSAYGEPTVYDSAQAQAIGKYPELAVANSSFHFRFMQEVAKAKAARDAVLNQADWPLVIADRVAASGVLVFPPGATLEEKKQLIIEHQKERAEAVVHAQTRASIAARERGQKESAAAALRGMNRTVREVETDIPSFLDQPIVLHGTIDVSNYYNYGFSKAQPAYYAFDVKDETGTASVYMKKDEAGTALRQAILRSGPQYVACKIGIASALYDHESSIHAYLMDYKILSKAKEEEK